MSKKRHNKQMEFFDLLKSRDLFVSLPKELQEGLDSFFDIIYQPVHYMLSARFVQSKKARASKKGADLISEARQILIETGQVPK